MKTSALCMLIGIALAAASLTSETMPFWVRAISSFGAVAWGGVAGMARSSELGADR